MGKAAKAHRAKVEKRNKRIAQEKYAMQNKLNKMMQAMAEQKDVENLDIKLGDENIPFEVVPQPTETGIKGFETGSIVEFKENHSEDFEPEFDSAGFSVADREPDTNQE
jgi:hypothetical protein